MAAATERQEEPFIANGLKERLGMGMERREERENGVRRGQLGICKISFSEISLKFREEGSQFALAQCSACGLLLLLGIRWWKSGGGDRVKSPFSCDVDHNLYGHFMARRRRKKEGDPDPMQSATVDAWVSGPIVEKRLKPAN